MNIFPQTGLSCRGSGGFRADEGNGAVVGLELHMKIVFLVREAYFSRITWDALAETRLSREIRAPAMHPHLILEKYAFWHEKCDPRSNFVQKKTILIRVL